MYRCTPTELDAQPSHIVELHLEIMDAEMERTEVEKKKADEEKFLEEQRQRQDAKLRK